MKPGSFMRLKRETVFFAMILMLNAAAASAEDKVYTLQDAYEVALATNEVVKIAEEGAVQAGSRVDQAWTYLYPRLTAQGAYTKYNEVLPPNATTNVFQPLDEVRASLILTQPLYTGGRTLAGLRIANNSNEASKRDLSSAKQVTLLNVTEAYYGVLKARRMTEISRNSLERMERHKKVTEREAATRRTKANVSALLRANTLVSQARIALVKAEDGLKIARKKLNLLTKLPEDAAVAEPQPAEPPTGELDTLKQDALKNRDDYVSSELNRNNAKEYVTIVKGGHYPQLYAEAALKYQGSTPNTLMDATTYYGGIRLQIPIFEGGLMKAEVSEARSKQRQAELSRDLLRRKIEDDVYDAYIDLQTVSAVLETSKLQLDYAKSNFDSVEGLFDEGLVSSLTVIDAQQALFFAELEFMNAVYDRQVSIVRFKKSLGLLGKEL